MAARVTAGFVEPMLLLKTDALPDEPARPLVGVAHRLRQPGGGSAALTVGACIQPDHLRAHRVGHVHGPGIGAEYRVRALGAFVLPVVVALGLVLPTGLRSLALEPAIRSAWIWVHVALALLGLAALVLNFAAAVMYVLQERQLKTRRPSAVYYRLPPLETLDRLSHRTLTLGFPFLTAGLLLGVLWAGAAWGSVLTWDPLALFSILMWLVYAATLAGRTMGRWHGRRAAYFAIAGFGLLLLTLCASVLLQGRHGA